MNIVSSRQIFVFTILLLLTNVLVGQSIDVESEKFPGTKKLIVKSYDGCCAQKGFKSIYYFDTKGRAIKSSNYFKRRLQASYVYHYNEQGLLAEKINVYDIRNNSRKDTTKYIYSFDDKGRVISKIKYFNKWIATDTYSDFDSLNNAQTLTHIFTNIKYIEKRHFNSSGQQIFNQRLENDTITHIEENRYNQFGDKIYSNIPTLVDKETGKMIMLLGGNRHYYLEEYEYTYDKLHRWTEKYVIYNNKKVLLEKRNYK